ncbi:MAG: hypothetical protein RL090_165 [Bacteroidota bacterium]
MLINSKSYAALMTLVLISAFSFIGCDKDEATGPAPTDPTPPSMTIEMSHLAGSQKFWLDSTYTNQAGENFTSSMFKYYISNIRLVDASGTLHPVPDSYFLVDQANINSMTMELKDLDAGTYTGIRFIIGVDSARNCSGAQTGALDPINGMFWTWNTGYIFMKLEGDCPQGFFEYHIGGYKGTNVNFREVELDFNGDELIIANNKKPELHLVTDVLEIFKNPNTISFDSAQVVTMPGMMATSIADNYEDMIRYDHLHNE